ncbi:MAG: L-threonylcarbamoyladenylate synthase [Nanoarchaeota archaeon]
MRVLTKDELDDEGLVFLQQLRREIFIYPTDTIYGIGCDARNERLVHRLRAIKRRQTQPFSVIAPSKKWILENCILDVQGKEWLSKLPGPFTLVLRLKNVKAVSSSVNGGSMTLGVRIPDHWISGLVRRLQMPLITTSANVHGGNVMTCEDDVSPALRREVPVMLYDGVVKGHPSTIVRLDKDRPQVIRR